MKKIKVTKRVRAKTPWYERPPILFAVLAVLLAGAGLLMAYLSRGTGSSSRILGGRSQVDSTQVAQQAPAAGSDDWREQARHVLATTDALPAASPGAVLPPMRAETFADAGHVRTLLRQARDLHPAQEGGAGAYGCVPAVVLAAAQQTGRLTDPAWAETSMGPECKSCCDFELQRDQDGQLYLLGFVDLETAEALGALGPALDLSAVPPAETRRWWQIWKKKPPERIVLRRGSRILLYPDLVPEGVCAVALPLRRLDIGGVQRIREGVGRPVEYLEAHLK